MDTGYTTIRLLLTHFTHKLALIRLQFKGKRLFERCMDCGMLAIQ